MKKIRGYNSSAKKEKKEKKSFLNFSGIFLSLLCAGFLLANFLVPYDPSEVGIAPPFSSPSPNYLFGTDDLGRDLFSRVLYGGRITISMSLLAALTSLVIGTIWGFAAGIFRGWLDEILMRIADAVMSIPALLFALVCISGLGANFLTLMLVTGILLAPSTARMARSALLVENGADYVTAGRAAGLDSWRLVLREILPNIASQLLVQFSINAASAVMLEATLSFIGLGVQPPSASLGTLILQGYSKIYNSYWFVLFPSLVVVLIVLLLNSLAEHTRKSMEFGKSSS